MHIFLYTLISNWYMCKLPLHSLPFNNNHESIAAGSLFKSYYDHTLQIIHSYAWGKLYQPSAALTVSWLCSLPLHNCSGPGLGALHLAWEERDDLPPGPGQMVQSLRQMLSTGGSQSVFGPAAMHSSAAPGRGLARHGAHLTTIPHLTPAAQPTVALSWGPQPCHGPPLGDAELCCVGKMSFMQSASQGSSLLCTPDRNAPRIYLTQEVNAVKQCDLVLLAKYIFVLDSIPL